MTEIPLDGVTQANEYDLTKFNSGATPKTDGSVTLTPNNFIPEQFLRELSADGAPPGWNAVRGPEMEGYFPYITQDGSNGAVATLHKQTANPLPPEQDVYEFNTPTVSGGRPPTLNSPDVVIPAEARQEDGSVRLEAPVVTKVAATVTGFPQGEYLAAISFIGRGGSHTLTTDPVPFTINSDGQLVEFKLLTDADRELVGGQGLWLSEPVALGGTPDYNTLRLQEVAPNRGRTYTLKGPYKWNGRKAPKKNETAIGRPEEFRYHRDFNLRGHQGRDLQIGRWLFHRVESSRVGDSLAAPHSVQRHIQNEKKNHGYVFHPKKLHPEAIGYKIFCQDLDEAINPPFYQLMRVRRGDKARYFSPKTRPVFFGVRDAEVLATTTVEEPDTGDSGGKDSKKDRGGDEEKEKGPERYIYVLVAADPPTEDASGIESPTGETDPPVAVGIGRPGAGTYKVGYTKRFSNGETVISPLVSITITSSEVIQMQLPPRVNKIPNALYGQLTQKGLPMNWEIRDSVNALVTATSSNTNFERAGLLYLSTTGSLANAGRYPNATQPSASLIAVDKDRIETIAGFLEVSSRATGNGYVELVQYDDAKADLVANLTLGTLSANGRVWIEKTIGGSGLGADITLNDSTAYVGIRWGAEGNPRQLRVKWHTQIWAPQDGIPRRFEPVESPLDLWIATVDPATPYPSSHVLAIGPAPGTAADVASSDPPLEITSYDSLADGAEPAGWTQTLTNAGGGGAAGAYSGTGATTFGNTKTYRVKSDNTGAKSSAYIQKTFSPSGDALAVLFRIYFEQMPTRNPSNVRVGAIRTSAGQNMAQLRVRRTGSAATANSVDLVTTNASNKEVVTTLFSGRKATDYAEVEIVLAGGDTSTGVVSTSYGINGASRGPGAGQSNLDFTGRLPAVVRTGGHEESHSDTKWAFQFGKLAITETGYISVENTQPALTAIPQPDVPLKTGTTLSGPATGSIDYTHGSALSRTGLVGTFNRGAGALTAKTIMKITNSAGTTELARVQTTATNTIQVVVTKSDASTTTYEASGALDASTDYRFDLVVDGAGGSAGSAFFYRKRATGPRELYVQATGVDWSTSTAQRATVAANAELTETAISVTSGGEYEYDKYGPDFDEGGNPIPANQEYVSILPADVLEDQETIGFDIEEFFVKPGVQRTAALYLRVEDFPSTAEPFTIVEYDDNGVGTDLVSVYADGTTVTLPGGNGWIEKWLTYTPTQKRIRWEHRGMTQGRYVAYKRLDEIGNLNTQALRDAKRNEGYATSGIMGVVLNSRIPSQTGTGHADMWQEARERLGVTAETPTGTSVTVRYRAASGLSGLTGASWQTDTALVPDLEWVEIEVTLTGDGIETPIVPPGGAHLFYTCFMPLLLRDDRTPLPGGAYVGGGSDINLSRPYRRSLFDTESVGDRAAPRAITSRIGRLDGVTFHVWTPEALDEVQSDDFLKKDWYIESPFHDLVMRVRFYEPPSEAVNMESFEYPHFDEGHPVSFWVPKTLEVERAEVVEAGPLS